MEKIINMLIVLKVILLRDNFLPEELNGTKFYEPGTNPKEAEIRKRLGDMWKDQYDY